MRPLILLLVVVLLPATAWSGDAAEEVAARAQRAHEEHCPEVAGTGDEGDAARAIGEVSAVWVDVTEVYEETGATWLLYWRGVLAQCLGQSDRAAEALAGFLESDPTSEGLTAMMHDAHKRLRRLRPDDVPIRAPRPAPSPEERQRSGRVAAGAA